jgi:hypothetical protein
MKKKKKNNPVGILAYIFFNVLRKSARNVRVTQNKNGRRL